MNLPSIKKNYIYRLLYEALVLITPFITTPYVSRVLGADGIGIYSYTSSIMTYFTLFGALGTVSYGAREIAQHRDDRQQSSKLFWEIELMTVGTSSVCLVIWCFFVAFSREYRPYYIALIPVLLGTMTDISWYFTGHEQVKYIVLRNAACKVIGIVLLFVFIKKPSDLLLYIVINSGVTLLGNLSMWTYLPRMLVKIDFRTLGFKRHFHETLIYFIPAIATSVYTVLDKTLIGLITGDNFQNGYYEQASKVVKIVKTLVFTSVNSVMGARISYLFAEERFEEIRRRIRRSMDFILLFGYGSVFGILGTAERFVPSFFGDGYRPVIQLMCLMSPLILIVGVSNCLGTQYYTPSGQRKRSAKVIILGSLVNLCLNLCMIPAFGAVGATVATLIAESVISVLYVRMSGGYMTWKILWSQSRKRILAGAIMCAVIILLDKAVPLGNVQAVLLQVAVGGSIYLGLLLLLKDSMLYELIDMAWKLIRKGKRGNAAN